MKGPGRSVEALELGRTVYGEALAMQQRLHARRVAGDVGDLLLVTEHERVITLGRNAGEGNIRVSPAALDQLGIPVVRVERGGDVTYHGPGQIVAYPLIDLRAAGIGVREYVRLLEQSAIALLQGYGIAGERRAGLQGIWTEEGKIASVGVYVSHWVTMHGIAINVAPNLADFGFIDPCGLAGVVMTSVAAIKGKSPGMEEAFRDYVRSFAEVFGFRLFGTAPEPAPIAGSRHDRA